MADENVGSVTSTASIRGHPIHPMLVPFPIAFLVGALATDLAYWGTADIFWARASLWLVGAGLAMGSVAAVFGLTDFVTIRQARRRPGWIHLIGNVMAVGLALVSVMVRWSDPAAAILPEGLILSVVIAAILVVTGWMGGELAYRYRVGVMPVTEAGQAPPSRAATTATGTSRPGEELRAGAVAGRTDE